MGERCVSELHAAYQTICDPPINSPHPTLPVQVISPLFSRGRGLCRTTSTTHNSRNSRGATESRRIHPDTRHSTRKQHFPKMDVVTTGNGHSISTIKKWILVSNNNNISQQRAKSPIQLTLFSYKMEQNNQVPVIFSKN